MLKGTVIENYKILTILRPGGGGNVYVAEDLRTQEKVVLKSSFVDESKRSEFERIIHGWKKLSDSCRNIVQFKEVFYKESNSFVVMEFCSGGDLETLIKKRKLEEEKFTEAEISKIANGIFSGLQAIHAMKMIHRDLKTGNILIAADGTYKIADFNVSRIINDNITTSMTFAGTLQYVAPEILQNKSPSFASDAYSMGAVLYELLALTPAFSGMDIPSVLANRYAPLDSTALGCPAALTHLVHSLLALDPATRPSAAQVLLDPVLVRGQVQGVQAELSTQAASVVLLQQTIASQQETISTLQRSEREQQDTINTLQRSGREQQEKINALQRTVEELQASFKRASERLCIRFIQPTKRQAAIERKFFFDDNSREKSFDVIGWEKKCPQCNTKFEYDCDNIYLRLGRKCNACKVFYLFDRRTCSFVVGKHDWKIADKDREHDLNEGDKKKWNALLMKSVCIKCFSLCTWNLKDKSPEQACENCDSVYRLTFVKEGRNTYSKWVAVRWGIKNEVNGW